ncbi:MAG: DUF4363 family protein [Clostridia bacterium]|jgi:predicted negative regulator of RcsB-dependent stress response|nr:DUF4363 family protein [Clostridia bacterium]
MTKELIICIIIISVIFIGNFLTENYTKDSIIETTSNLEELRKEITKDEEEINFDIAKQKIDNVHEKWDARYAKLAYYIEHDELEKVETELRGLKGYIEKEEHTEALAELDKSIFILEHIKEKTSLNLKNIF